MKDLISMYPDKFDKPIQYTTRKPRWDNELDDYVFLTREQFHRKLINGDFIEFTLYNKELYAVWRYYNAEKANIFIAEPVGREALQKFFKLNSIPFVTFYMKVPKDEMLRRLEERRMSIRDIDSRMEDLKYFYPLPHDHLLDGTDRREAVAIEAKKIWDNSSRT